MVWSIRNYITFFINILGLLMVILYPGTTTLISTVIILATNTSWLFSFKKSDRYKNKLIKIMYVLEMMFIVSVGVVIFFIAVNSKVEVQNLEEVPKQYYIILNSEMAFFGGIKIEYIKYAIPIAILSILPNIEYIIFANRYNNNSWESISHEFVE